MTQKKMIMKLTETTSETGDYLKDWFIHGWIYWSPDCSDNSYTFVPEYETEVDEN